MTLHLLLDPTFWILIVVGLYIYIYITKLRDDNEHVIPHTLIYVICDTAHNFLIDLNSFQEIFIVLIYPEYQ